jgi:hypothetical protein
MIGNFLLSYYLACSVGAVASVRFPQFMLNSHVPWYQAGISGLATSSVWTYDVNDC